ncbi:hypothetical protein EI94DRAFT_1667463 [Lactarius quietus]|nr:hypothetical protein EI94DRAFT_1671608 [Lactarius quietus]KAF8261057.1 hypothetical protein EI94DRAFT_1667463 [Lactarius quietus]
MTSAFFYGALMHPRILKRVLHNDASHLKICPSILSDYMRHKVKDADYPAIAPAERSKAVLGRELTSEENSIRGMLVSGLTAEDVACLDAFEGDARKYVRLQVLVHPLGPFTPVPADVATSMNVEYSLIPADLLPPPSVGELAQTVPAQTYAWGQDDGYLDKELWSFDEFVQKNAWRWIDHGAGPRRNEEVDRVREMPREGIIPDGVTV